MLQTGENWEMWAEVYCLAEKYQIERLKGELVRVMESKSHKDPLAFLKAVQLAI